MLSLHAVPRKLAGDLMLLSKGIRPLQIFRQAFEATVAHVTDSGGKLAPNKSRIFATAVSHRVGTDPAAHPLSAQFAGLVLGLVS